MPIKFKIEYLNILSNIKNNVYENDRETLKKDLITLRNMLVIYQGNEHMQKLEKNMTKVLTRTR